MNYLSLLFLLIAPLCDACNLNRISINTWRNGTETIWVEAEVYIARDFPGQKWEKAVGKSIRFDLVIIRNDARPQVEPLWVDCFGVTRWKFPVVVVNESTEILATIRGLAMLSTIRIRYFDGWGIDTYDGFEFLNDRRKIK